MNAPLVLQMLHTHHPLWDMTPLAAGLCLSVVHLSVAEQPLSARLHLRKLLSTKRLLTEIGERGLGVTNVLGVRTRMENTDHRLSSLTV